MKLTIELVPQTCWYSNVRSNVSKTVWDSVRKASYRKANNVCEVCGETGLAQGFRHKLECHEIWDYNDSKKIQSLKSFISLCPLCHKVKHPGLAGIKGETELVINQLVKVNNISRNQAEAYLRESFRIWEARSQFEWTLDLSYLDFYLAIKNSL